MISNLCGPGPPTQRHRQTDDMRSQYRALHYSAKKHYKGNSAEKHIKKHMPQQVKI